MRWLLVLAITTMLACAAMGCHHTGAERMGSGEGCATCGQGGGATIVQNAPGTGEPPVNASN